MGRFNNVSGRFETSQTSLVQKSVLLVQELLDDVLLGTVGVAPRGQPVPDESAKRRRRAIAIAAVALIAVAAAGIVYLRSGTTLRTGTPVTPNPPAGPNPVTYSFVTPTLGWAALNVTNAPSPPAQFEVFNTTDGAQHWRLQLTAHGSTPGFAQLTVHLFNNSNGFMALGLPSVGEQLYRTSDRGDTWTQLQLPSTPCVEVTFVDARQGWALVQDPAEPTSGQLFDLYETSDGGSSWQRLPDPPRDAYYMAIRAPGEAWMGSLGAGPPHLYASADAGQNWHRYDLPAPQGRSWDSTGHGTTVALLPEHGVVATTGFTTTSPNPSEPALFTSFDQGSTWRYLAPPPGDVAYQDASHWWAVKDTALFKSADAGLTWKQITDTLPTWQLVPHVLDAKHAWAELSVVGGFGLGLTDDGGLHWRPANVPSVT
jgi:photosystem II stability/assembly factor-like uncharacterized protein